ncbi:MAG TPA: WxL domain-containing protein [Acidimicrobiia bacterium]|jgi:hypothetical protein
MRRVRFVTVVVAVAGAALLTSISPALGAGTLDFDPPGPPTLSDFTPVTLNGSPQLSSATLTPFSVTDDTGSGAGWKLVFKMTQLTTGVHSLATGSVTMPAPVVVPASGNTATAPIVHDCAGSSALDTAGGCRVAVADPAAPGDGLGSPGTWLFSPKPLVLTIPNDVFVGTYSSTFTATLSTGP